MIDLKHLNAELREIEFMVLAVLDAAETIIGDPQSATAAATLLDFGLQDIAARIAALREALRE
jgi:hypothetical protein